MPSSEILWMVVIGVVFLLLVSMSVYVVSQQTVAVVQRMGKFLLMGEPGLRLRVPFIDQIAGKVNMRIREMVVDVSTKTKDNVFVTLVLAVQFHVDPERVWDAFYRLDKPEAQIESYIFDTVRAKVPTMSLDEVFDSKEQVAVDVADTLREVMESFGYIIDRALVNDVRPDAKVVAAMNEINAQARLRLAAVEKGEGEKILVVKAAEADAESKRLSGEGVAKQRAAIVQGLEESVQKFQDAIGVSPQEVMTLVMMTQYFDTISSVTEHARGNVILLPYGPGAVGDIQGQLLAALTTSKDQEDSLKIVVGEREVQPGLE